MDCISFGILLTIFLQIGLNSGEVIEINNLEAHYLKGNISLKFFAPSGSWTTIAVTLSQYPHNETTDNLEEILTETFTPGSDIENVVQHSALPGMKYQYNVTVFDAEKSVALRSVDFAVPPLAPRSVHVERHPDDEFAVKLFWGKPKLTETYWQSFVVKCHLYYITSSPYSHPCLEGVTREDTNKDELLGTVTVFDLQSGQRYKFSVSTLSNMKMSDSPVITRNYISIMLNSPRAELISTRNGVAIIRPILNDYHGVVEVGCIPQCRAAMVSEQVYKASNLKTGVTYSVRFRAVSNDELEVVEWGPYLQFKIEPYPVHDLNARTETSDNTVRLSWTNPAVWQYVNITCSTNMKSTAECKVIHITNSPDNKDSQSEVAVPGLTLGRTYRFSFTVVMNDISDTNNKYIDVTVPPGPPTDVNIKLTNEYFAPMLSWQPPASGHYEGYYVLCEPSCTQVSDIDMDTTRVVLDGLIDNSEYQTLVSITATAAGVQSRPVKLSLSEVSNSSCTLSQLNNFRIQTESGDALTTGDRIDSGISVNIICDKGYTLGSAKSKFVCYNGRYVRIAWCQASSVSDANLQGLIVTLGTALIVAMMGVCCVLMIGFYKKSTANQRVVPLISDVQHDRLPLTPEILLNNTARTIPQILLNLSEEQRTLDQLFQSKITMTTNYNPVTAAYTASYYAASGSPPPMFHPPTDMRMEEMATPVSSNLDLVPVQSPNLRDYDYLDWADVEAGTRVKPPFPLIFSASASAISLGANSDANYSTPERSHEL